MNEETMITEEDFRNRVINFSKKAELYGTNCFRTVLPKPIMIKDGESLVSELGIDFETREVKLLNYKIIGSKDD